MKLSKNKPIIWPLVKLCFKEADFTKTAFTWGDTVYAAIDLPRHMLVHEEVHCKQQRYSKVIGLFGILTYVLLRTYRRKCEVEAYRAQLAYIRATETPERAELARLNFARFMSSPLYNMMTLEEALEALK